MSKSQQSFEEYRNKLILTPLQKELLQHSWDMFLASSEWPFLREIYSKHGRQKVETALELLTGNVCYEERGNRHLPVLRLKLLAVLLTHDGQHYHELLLRFLELQRSYFISEPMKPHLTCDEIARGLNLDKSETELLSRLLYIADIGGSSFAKPDWAVFSREDVELFPRDGSLTGELDKVIFRYYRGDACVFERNRTAESFVQLAPSFGNELNPSFAAAIQPQPAKPEQPNTAFIMMSMAPDQPGLVDVCNAIKEVCRAFGVSAVRADDIEHEGRITDVILDRIRTAEFLIADLTGDRPNVYYEVGYAHAINKRTILYRRSGTVPHFDLAGYNIPEYQNLTDLKQKLTKRLEGRLGRKPKIDARA